ncbi:HAD family hydrolase [Pyrococcus horikoshii]|uniref:Beta-phosphoglucomutase n=2 Tax=Pyrococcus horikoshii TaxID=53953 RepID=O58510_PYRHO|nr:HAD family phosphatase [Pyrococcus horikoshii]BAA29840.1 230aa long hypothetical protein [Pyrococcus horikoshii OT3]HII61399.1 HAD family phosphatase [Pyrococcus horikoshii]
MKPALIWDFDGVLVYTPHEKAWREATRKYGGDIDHEFYVKYVSGKPRYEGAHNILTLTGIYEKYGANSEEEKERLLKEFAEFKNKILNELIDKGEYEVNWGAIEFLLNAKKSGILNALASASRNASKLASRIIVNDKRLVELFDVNVSGLASTKKEVFRLAIEELKRRFSPTCFIIIEDAPAGVKAGKELGSLVLGYERDTTLEEADMRFRDFKELNPSVIFELCKEGKI